MKKTSLRYKLLFFFVILALIPLGVAGWNMITITQDELKSAANDEISSLALQVSGEIDNFYLNTWAAPLLLMRDAIDNENLSTNAKVSILTLGVQEVVDLVALQLEVDGFPQPVLVTQDLFRDNLLSAGVDPEGVLTIPTETIQAMKKPGEVSIGGLEYLPEIDAWVVNMVLQLEKPLLGREATLAARINLYNLRRKIENYPFARNNLITLIESDGRTIFDPERTQMGGFMLIDEALGLMNSTNRAISVHHYSRPDGEEMLGAYSFPLYLEWGILVEKQKSLAYLAVAKMRKSLLIYVLIGLAVAVVTAIFVARGLSRPLEKLTGAAQILAQGDFSVKIEGKERRDEIGQLSKAFLKMAVDLKRYIEELTETTKVKERAESELRMGRDIQQSFIPKVFPVNDNIDFFGECDAAKKVGGDFIDYIKFDDDKYGFCVGDVSGKGVPAALFMSMCRTLFQMLAREEPDPAEMLMQLNNRLIELDPSGNLFITIYYGILDCKTNKITFSTAGHNMPFVKLVSKGDTEFNMLPRVKTMVAGMLEDIELEIVEMDFYPGDIMVLYTDGMTEPLDINNVEFGEEGMMKLLDEIHTQPAKEISNKSIEIVKKFQVGLPQFDDMTMFVIKRKGVEATA